jgi:hypothetical protein
MYACMQCIASLLSLLFLSSESPKHGIFPAHTRILVDKNHRHNKDGVTFRSCKSPYVHTTLEFRLYFQQFFAKKKDCKAINIIIMVCKSIGPFGVVCVCAGDRAAFWQVR